MVSKDFIQTEILAEHFVNDIAKIKRLLEEGDIHTCLPMVSELEVSMQVILAYGERIDLPWVN